MRRTVLEANAKFEFMLVRPEVYSRHASFQLKSAVVAREHERARVHLHAGAHYKLHARRIHFVTLTHARGCSHSLAQQAHTTAWRASPVSAGKAPGGSEPVKRVGAKRKSRLREVLPLRHTGRPSAPAVSARSRTRGGALPRPPQTSRKPARRKRKCHRESAWRRGLLPEVWPPPPTTRERVPAAAATCRPPVASC